MNGTSNGQKPRRTLIGTVVSDKMDKTVVVEIASLRRHRLYGKMVRRTRRFKAHDEANAAHSGDQVEIAESRPVSREKRWAVVRILHEQRLPDQATASEGA